MKNIENVLQEEQLKDLVEEVEVLNSAVIGLDEGIQDNFENPIGDIFDIKLLRGHYSEVGHPTFAIQMKCKRYNDIDEVTFTYRNFFDKKHSGKIMDKLIHIYPLSDTQIKLTKDYIKELLDRDKYDPVENIDELVGGIYSNIGSYRESMVDYVLDNTEKIASRSKNDYRAKKHTMLFLDREEDVEKYGKNAIAILSKIITENIILKEDGKKVDTTSKRKILEKLVSEDIFHAGGRNSAIQITPCAKYIGTPRFHIINIDELSMEAGDENGDN